MTGRARRWAVSAVALLERPNVILLAVPLGAVWVGAAQVTGAHGVRGPLGALLLALAALVYLSQAVALLADPRWASSRRAVPILVLAMVSTFVWDLGLVAPPAPVRWVWLLPPVLMVAAYVCRTTELVVVTALGLLTGVAFVAGSGTDLRSAVGPVVLVLVALPLPAVLTRRALGNLREVQEQVDRLGARDPLTGALNRTGLLARLARDAAAHHGDADPPGPLDEGAVLVLRLEGFRALRSRLGGARAGEILSDVATAAAGVFRRDHAVARLEDLRGDDLVVVTRHAPEQVGAALLAAVQPVLGAHAVAPGVGAVQGVPLRRMDPARLDAVVRTAAAQARRPGRVSVVDLGPLEDLPTTPVADGGPAPGGRGALPPTLVAELGAIGSRADERLLGAGLVVVGLLVACLRQDLMAARWAHVTVVGGAAVVAATGVLVLAGWVRSGGVHALAVALAFVVVALAPTIAASTLWHRAGLTLVLFPAYLAALTLPMRWGASLLVLVPPAAVVAVLRAPRAVDPLTTLLGLVLLGLVTCGLALWVRSLRDRTNRRRLLMARTDALTGLLSREGLAAHHDALAPGTAVALVSLDVDGLGDVNRTLGRRRGDDLLRAAAGALLDAADGVGVAARMGGDELVLLVEGHGQVPAVLRRLDERAAVLDPPVDLSTGCAYGTVGAGTSVSGLLARADEALLEGRAQRRRPGPSRPARPRHRR